MSQASADQVIATRGMELSKPFVATMDTLIGMGPSHKLLRTLDREPFPRYHALHNQGFTHRTKITAVGRAEIPIWCRQP